MGWNREEGHKLSVRADDIMLRLIEGVFAGSPIGMALIAPDLRLLRVNDALRAMPVEGDVSEALGRDIREQFPTVWAVAGDRVKAVAEGRSRLEQVTLERPGPDGVFISLLLIIYPVYNDVGAVEAIAVTVADITNETNATRSAERSESQLHLALDAAQMGTWWWKFDREELVWNTTMRTMFGLNADEPITLDHFFANVDPDDRDAVRADIDRAIAQDGAFRTEFRTIWEDGSTHWILSRGQVQLDSEGKPLAMLGISLDITEQKAIVDADFRGEIENRLERIGRYHPSRLIVCAVRRGQATLDARASLAAEASGVLSVGREHVEAEIGPQHLRSLDTIVDPLLVNDLATVVWAPHGH